MMRPVSMVKRPVKWVGQMMGADLRVERACVGWAPLLGQDRGQVKVGVCCPHGFYHTCMVGLHRD